MNIETVRKYMTDVNKDKFNGMLNFQKIKFEPSPDNGIILDVDEGVHHLRIGRKITEHQMNRALIVMLIDTVMNVTEEHQRKNFGDQSYGEYGGKVSQLQERFFPNHDVFVETDGKIVKDSVIDCDAVMCRLKSTGSVEKDRIMGLKVSEVKLKK